MFLIFSLLIIFILQLSGAMESRIIGGKEVKPHSRPYMVSFQRDKRHVCGGMLIREDYVLTSAHCLDDYGSSGKKEKLEVVLGAHNISQKEHSQQRIQVKNPIKHPSYNGQKNFRSYDIMLLKLKTKAKPNNFVKVIALPKGNEKIPANQKCHIAGWGKKEQCGSASDILQEVTLKLQFNFECKNIWMEYFDSQRMICTASDGNRGFCQGDSGSPLICNNEPQGIAAFTYPGNCLNRKFPELYIKTGFFLPWIKEVIKST